MMGRSDGAVKPAISVLVVVGFMVVMAVLGILLTKAIVYSDLPLWLKVMLLR